MHLAAKRRGAFSLIELVVVVVILGLIATIAIPRVSRGAEGAADSALRSDLAVLRNALELYQAEHEGEYPLLANLPDALTEFTDVDGNTNATRDTTHIYGPYLAAVPTLKLGANRGEDTIANAAGTGVAWIYDEATGDISANVTGTDASGVDYADY